MKARKLAVSALLILSLVGSGSVFADVSKFRVEILPSDPSAPKKLITIEPMVVTGHRDGGCIVLEDGKSQIRMTADIVDGQLLVSEGQDTWREAMEMVNGLYYKVFMLPANESSMRRYLPKPAATILHDGKIVTYLNNCSAITSAVSVDEDVYTAPLRTVLEAHGYKVEWIEDGLIISRPYKSPTLQEVTQ